MAAFGDENANNINIQVDDVVKPPLGEMSKPGDQPVRTSLGEVPASQAPAAKQPQLEPSLSAWAASRPLASAALTRNIGASERSGEAELAPELSVCTRRTSRSSSTSKDRRLSTEEIESIRIEHKRQEVHALMRKNQVTCKEAIENPMTNMPGSRSLNVTVPQEFNLSTSSRPRARSRSADSSKGHRRRGRSQSRGKTWTPQLTVPRGPQLTTAHRAESRSASASRRTTPASTPERFHSLSRDSLLPPREAAAVEEHFSRMALVRALGRRVASASPARSRVAASPARSCRSCRSASDMSICSISSRLSQLSRPRSLSRPHLTSDQIEHRQAEEGRRQLHEQLRSNERNLPKVLLQPEPVRPSSRELTVPLSIELNTERRARSRSTSVRSCRSVSMDSATSDRRPPRELQAVAKHVERMTTAQVLEKATADAERGDGRAVAAIVHDGASEKQQRWIREAPDAVERARRARAVAKALRCDVEKVQRSRLCIFTRGEDLDDEVQALELAQVVKTVSLKDDDAYEGDPESTPERRGNHGTEYDATKGNSSADDEAAEVPEEHVLLASSP